MHQDWHQVRLVAFTTRPPPRSPSGAPRIARSPLRFVMHASTTRRPRLHPPANAGSEHARRLASVGNLTLVHLDRTGPRPRGARRLPKCRVGQRAAGWAHGRTAGGSGRAEAGAPAARESPLTWSPYKPIVRRWTAPGHTARPGEGPRAQTSAAEWGVETTRRSRHLLAESTTATVARPQRGAAPGPSSHATVISATVARPLRIWRTPSTTM